MTTTLPNGTAIIDGDSPASILGLAYGSQIDEQLGLRKMQTFIWEDASGRTTQTGMNEGDLGFQKDTRRLYQRVSGSWTPRGARAVASGTVSIPTTGGVLVNPGVSFSSSIGITFPPGLFTEPPVVTAHLNSPAVGWVGQTQPPTTAGASLCAFRINTLATGSITWNATEI